jgi:hypothetical protein
VGRIQGPPDGTDGDRDICESKRPAEVAPGAVRVGVEAEVVQQSVDVVGRGERDFPLPDPQADANGLARDDLEGEGRVQERFKRFLAVGGPRNMRSIASSNSGARGGAWRAYWSTGT